MSPRGLSRRAFLARAGATAGALVIGFRLPERLGAAAPPPDDFAPNSWLRVASDGTVTLTLDKSELGQGTHTALAMIVADELEADWELVRVGPMPEYPAAWSRVMQTGGSTGVYTSYQILRRAAATARAMLTTAAAAAWNVDPTTCRAENGGVVHAASGRRAAYGSLVARAAAVPVPVDPPLKDPREFRLIGTRVKRLDAPAKADGSATYGIDVTVPGMLVASVERCPVMGGRLARFNAERARAVPGVRHVVPMEAIPWQGARGAMGVGRVAGVAVVADSWWPASQGRRALTVEWDAGPGATLDSAGIHEELVRRGETGPAVRARGTGDAPAALAAAARRLDAVYETPFVYHAPMEPMNCTAHVRADACEVWAPTQFPTRAQQVAAEITGLPLERVRVHTTYAGGAFGRRNESDFVAEAVELSRATGAPVKVIWSRADDVRHDFFRPITLSRLSAGLDAAGQVVAWTHRIVAPPLDVKYGPLRGGMDEGSLSGWDMPYAIPNVLADIATVEMPVPVGYWRSVALPHNAFVLESFLNEVAAAVGRDPFELRRSLLAAKPRHLRTLETAAERANWGSPLPAGRGRGIALASWGPTTCAQVAEVSVSETGAVKVHRVVCALDCGRAVNLAGIEAQAQGAVLFGLQAALYGRITLRGGRVEQSGFRDYHCLTLAEAPPVEVHVLQSGEPMGGIGEPPVGPIAPAVCNAIFAATGKRIRTLPIVA